MKNLFFRRQLKESRKRNLYIRGNRSLLKRFKKTFNHFNKKRFAHYKRRKFHYHIKKVVKPNNEKLDKELEDYFKKKEEQNVANTDVEMKEETKENDSNNKE